MLGKHHPAYTGGNISFAGIVIWYTAQGSWSWPRKSEVYRTPLASLVIAIVMAHLLSVALALFQRISKEDEILKKTFRKVWDKWARKVPAQLCPGIY